ncbi:MULTISPECIES: NYN domain-containing protein [Roseinatronobacter]|mgnify:CR=1 FL=1|uniref:RNase NYN domain-containing protein n=1 Tax=Roseinatronobacter domitianus TaxID=2940293 RepID=A0ABT0LY56_9RHOB|nr:MULTISPECIES: hypothetical protein [Roseibaca]MCL1627549.1 hypothetical protein [Roseibaca domitiana]
MSLIDFTALVSEHRLAVAGVGALILIALRLMLRSPRRKSGWRPAKGARFILVDGSNVMHWRDNTPDIEPVREVIASLKAQGFTPGVVFDANAGYKLEGRYRNHYKLARRIGLPHEQVMVVPRGEPADPMILRVARDYGGRVLSQDRFRDWEAEFPELRRPDFRVRGGYDRGKLWLDLKTRVAQAA